MLIGSYFVGKRLVNSQKEDIKEEILDYLSSPEGQLSIRNLGTIFGQGIAGGIGLKGKVRGGKIFGFPAEVVIPIVEKLMGKIGDKAISKEAPSSSSDGKFDT